MGGMEADFGQGIDFFVHEEKKKLRLRRSRSLNVEDMGLKK